jgi:hypothetical protein
MKHTLYLLLLLLCVACRPNGTHNPPSTPNTVKEDTLLITADFRKHGDYYNTGHQVFAIDLLSDGLTYDSTYHIYGSGCNLFLSDIFTLTDSLPAGHYTMDSVAKDMTFLRGMYFESNITGTYLLLINQDQIQRIILFTSGSMDIEYIDDEISIDFSLYTADSSLYHATYQGPVMYR